MERSTPVRKPHTSTADLLTWTETPLPASPTAESAGSGRGIRNPQPSAGISAVLFGGQMTEEEAESLMKRKPCSSSKLREISGSGIFAVDNENELSESGGAFSTPNNRTGLRLYQQATNAISQISFSADESISPKKPTTLTEVAKQRELSGNLDSESEARAKKQLSDAKCRELSGHDIFAPPPEIVPRPSVQTLQEESARNMHTSINVSNVMGQSSTAHGDEPAAKTSKKIHNQKFAELSGNDIFKGETSPASAEKALSVAKLREMSGSDIFADGKVAAREYYGGVRKPPGGESSIALV